MLIKQKSCHLYLHCAFLIFPSKTTSQFFYFIFAKIFLVIYIYKNAFPRLNEIWWKLNDSHCRSLYIKQYSQTKWWNENFYILVFSYFILMLTLRPRKTYIYVLKMVKKWVHFKGLYLLMTSKFKKMLHKFCVKGEICQLPMPPSSRFWIQVLSFTERHLKFEKM